MSDLPVIDGYSNVRPLTTADPSGFGDLYLATQDGAGREVVIKVLKQFAGPPELARFKREWELVGKLGDKHRKAASALIEIFQIGQTVMFDGNGRRTSDARRRVRGGLPFAAMRKVGPSLFSRVRETGRLQLQEALDLFTPLVELLSLAHAEKPPIIHLDLRPPNILFTHDGDALVLTDFGIAAVLEDYVTPDRPIGVPLHLPPEVLAGSISAPSVAWDLWSLSVTLWFAFTGAFPWGTGAFTELQALARAGRLVPTAAAPAGLDEFFSRAFHQDPKRRFQTASQWLSGFHSAALYAGATLPLPEPSDPRPMPTATPRTTPASTPPATVVGAPRHRKRLRPVGVLGLFLALTGLMLGVTGQFASGSETRTWLASLGSDSPREPSEPLNSARSRPTSSPGGSSVPQSGPTASSVKSYVAPPPPPTPVITSSSLSTTQVTAGESATFTYATRHITSGEHVVVQRAQGSAQSWVTIRSLTSKSGSAGTGGIPMGRQRLRIAVTNAAGSVLAAGAAKTVLSFGTVTWEQILGHGTNTVVIGTTTFRYASAPNINSAFYDSTGTRIAYVNASSCRSMTIRVGAVKDEPFGAGTSRDDSVSFIRESADPITVALPVETIQSFTASFAPGSAWSLKIAGTHYMYFNGTASCYATEKFLSD